jgi:hypothetical protein
LIAGDAEHSSIFNRFEQDRIEDVLEILQWYEEHFFEGVSPLELKVQSDKYQKVQINSTLTVGF